MCTGRPSAEASSSLSAVTIAQEKSRAWLMTDERAERSSVFVISRQMPSSRLATTARRIGSNVRSSTVLTAWPPLATNWQMRASRSSR